MDALGCALLPAFCALCGSPLPQLSSVPICAACWTEFPVQSGSLCARCGDLLDAPALAVPSSSGLCRPCRLAPPPFVRAVAYGPYQDRMRAAIHALKYDRLHPLARALGRMLAQAIAQLAADAPSEMLVVPVPLHRSKHAQRGFNQARSLAVHALDALRKTHPAWRLTLASSTLMRLRPTESQAAGTTNFIWAPTFKTQRTLPGCPAARRTRPSNRQASTHRTTNHLFDEGKRDVAGKSHDSCPQAKVHRQGRGL